MMQKRSGRRGSSHCAECGSLNGNRAKKCRICGFSNAKVAKLEPEYSSNVTALLSPEDTTKFKAVYSIRVRDQGPDYRCFVTLGHDGVYRCQFRDCAAAECARKRSSEEG